MAKPCPRFNHVRGCPRLQFDFQFGLYRVVAPLNLVSALHHCLLGN